MSSDYEDDFHDDENEEVILKDSVDDYENDDDFEELSSEDEQSLQMNTIASKTISVPQEDFNTGVHKIAKPRQINDTSKKSNLPEDVVKHESIVRAKLLSGQLAHESCQSRVDSRAIAVQSDEVSQQAVALQVPDDLGLYSGGLSSKVDGLQYSSIVNSESMASFLRIVSPICENLCKENIIRHKISLQKSNPSLIDLKSFEVGDRLKAIDVFSLHRLKIPEIPLFQNRLIYHVVQSPFVEGMICVALSPISSEFPKNIILREPLNTCSLLIVMKNSTLLHALVFPPICPVSSIVFSSENTVFAASPEGAIYCYSLETSEWLLDKIYGYSPSSIEDDLMNKSAKLESSLINNSIMLQSEAVHGIDLLGEPLSISVGLRFPSSVSTVDDASSAYLPSLHHQSSSTTSDFLQQIKSAFFTTAEALNLEHEQRVALRVLVPEQSLPSLAPLQAALGLLKPYKSLILESSQSTQQATNFLLQRGPEVGYAPTSSPSGKGPLVSELAVQAVVGGAGLSCLLQEGPRTRSPFGNHSFSSDDTNSVYRVGCLLSTSVPVEPVAVSGQCEVELPFALLAPPVSSFAGDALGFGQDSTTDPSFFTLCRQLQRLSEGAAESDAMAEALSQHRPDMTVAKDLPGDLAVVGPAIAARARALTRGLGALQDALTASCGVCLPLLSGGAAAPLHFQPSMSLQVPSSGGPLWRCTDFSQLRAGGDFLFCTSGGNVIRAFPFGDAFALEDAPMTLPRLFRRNFSDEFSGVAAPALLVRMHPSLGGVFVVAYGDGTVCLFSALEGTPLISLFTSDTFDSEVIQVEWIELPTAHAFQGASQTSALLVIHRNGAIRIWDLRRSVRRPFAEVNIFKESAGVLLSATVSSPNILNKKSQYLSGKRQSLISKIAKQYSDAYVVTSEGKIIQISINSDFIIANSSSV